MSCTFGPLPFAGTSFTAAPITLYYRRPNRHRPRPSLPLKIRSQPAASSLAQSWIDDATVTPLCGQRTKTGAAAGGALPSSGEPIARPRRQTVGWSQSYEPKGVRLLICRGTQAAGRSSDQSARLSEPTKPADGGVKSRRTVASAAGHFCATNRPGDPARAAGLAGKHRRSGSGRCGPRAPASAPGQKRQHAEECTPLGVDGWPRWRAKVRGHG